MSLSTVEKYCYPLEELLKTHFHPKSRDLNESRKALLLLLLTAHIPDTIKYLMIEHRIRGLNTRITRLYRYLRKFSNVPEAFCARYKYKMSVHRVMRRYNISERTWNYIHNLSKETDFELDIQLPNMDFRKFKWHERLEEHQVFTDIILDPRALNDMLVAIYEGYLAPRKKRRKGCEVYGFNMGMIRTTEVEEKRKGISIHKYVSVMRSSPQISANAARWWVEPNQLAMKALIKANMTLFPQNQILGDFHSHAYDSWNSLLYNEGWNYSKSDQNYNYSLSKKFSDMGHPFHIAFTVAIAKTKHIVKRRHFRGKKNMIQLRVGKCCAIVAAYRSLEKGRYSVKNLQLRLPGMVL